MNRDYEKNPMRNAKKCNMRWRENVAKMGPLPAVDFPVLFPLFQILFHAVIQRSSIYKTGETQIKICIRSSKRD